MTKYMLVVAAGLGVVSLSVGVALNARDVAEGLPALRTSVLTAREAEAAKTMLQDDARACMRAASERESLVFGKIRTRTDWEQYRDERLAAMKASFSPTSRCLASDLSASGSVHEVTSIVSGDGFRVENLVISGRPGQPIMANLYVPTTPVTGMPGILLVPSHHNSNMGRRTARYGNDVGTERLCGDGGRCHRLWRAAPASVRRA